MGLGGHTKYDKQVVSFTLWRGVDIPWVWGVIQSTIGRWFDILWVGGSFFIQFWWDLFLWIDCILYIIIISSKVTCSYHDISEKLLTNLFVIGQINWNLVGSNYGRYCIKFHSKQIDRVATQTQPTEPLICKLYCWT